ncbi:uncharacterized protein LOC107361857 [Tetranychus urticae]|uniref:Uncharacterized protein n=1 Tax=Tetranychus urticae TaxID=32264 RepID=T1K9H2_TETUR|nr:uncharacterized protein LOC107361857 [Tetranychus urticae]
MQTEFYIFLLFSVFPSIRSDEDFVFDGINQEYINSHGNYFLDELVYHFTFPLRHVHWIGDRFRDHQMVIRTFPTEINDFKENTELTKNISLEMETSCGSSKSAFDKTDLVTLTLMEKQNNRSVAVETIQIDPLSVDFYSPKPTMEQFKMLAEEEIKRRAKLCNDLCAKTIKPSNGRDILVCPNGTCTCNEKIEDVAKSYAEMEKFVKIMKYLELFQDWSSSCTLELDWYRFTPQAIVELDNKTASSLPKLNNNHYFIASFTDTKRRKSVALILKKYKII